MAVKGRVKATLEPHDQTAVKWKQTKGFLLCKQITATWDYFNMDKNTRVTGASLQGTTSHGVANYGKESS